MAAPNRMNFREKKSKWPSTPPSFSENYFAIFYNGYGRIHARRYKGQIVWNAWTWFPKIGTTLRGGGSNAVWNLYENSSNLVAWPVPQTCMTTRAFFKVCLVLIFLTTIVEKHVPRILKKFPLRSILMPKGLYEFETIPPSPFWKKENNKTTKDWQCGASQRGIEPFSPSIPPQLHDAMKQSKPFVIHAALLIQCGIMWLTFAENVILC